MNSPRTHRFVPFVAVFVAAIVVWGGLNVSVKEEEFLSASWFAEERVLMPLECPGPDTYEPNESFAGAWAITPPIELESYFCDDEDSDWLPLPCWHRPGYQS